MKTIYRSDWTLENLIQIFKTCKTKKEAIQKDFSAYAKVVNNGLKDIVFAHMPKRADRKGEESPHAKWGDETLQKIALKYDNRIEFREENPRAYDAAYKRGILETICAHMGESATYPWENKDLIAEALKHKTRLDFQKNNSGPYQAAKKRKMLDSICVHMKRSVCVSSHEEYLLNYIKSLYPKTLRLRDSKVIVLDKPYIKGFDIDIYVPEVRRGIEFDGKYWHSFEKMRASSSKVLWTDEDILNYHEIKDTWFASKGIKILHVKEVDWIKDREACIKKCLEFLETKDGL